MRGVSSVVFTYHSFIRSSPMLEKRCAENTSSDSTAGNGLQLETQRRGLQTSAEQQAPPEWQDRYGSTPRKGADILVQCLEREGVPTVFAYPGGASMEIHQALTRSDSIRNILCRHEQVLHSHHELGGCYITAFPSDATHALLSILGFPSTGIKVED